MTARPAPLAGVVVVETGAYISAPYAGMMLAHLGAEVVKVEPPSGDPQRKFGLRHAGGSAAWIDLNHGKSSVLLDLKDAGQREQMHDLIGRADVFMHNWRPGVAESLGFGADSLARRYPRLIQLAISGFGQTGPLSDRPVFDGLLQAASGFAAAEGGRGNPPTMTRSFVVDKVSAAFAAQAVVAALFDRERNGRGAVLDVAMLDVMAYFNFPDLAQDRTFLPPAPQVDLPPARSAILRTLDGHVLVSPVSGRQISSALTAVGHPEWKAEIKAIESPSALLHDLLDRLESVTVTWTTEECEHAFRTHDVPAAVVVDLEAHFADPQTIHNELYSTVDTPFGPVRRVRHPLRVDGDVLPAVAPPPPLPEAAPSGPSRTVQQHKWLSPAVASVHNEPVGEAHE